MSRILAAGAARMKLEAEHYEARIAALEAQLAELAAENERLHNALDGYGKFDADLAIAERRIEDLKQEVENWKTSAAGWQKIANVDAEALASAGVAKDKRERVLSAVFTWASVHGIPLTTGKLSDIGDRILSALEPHLRATNTVDAHETANVRDKPEGHQEPVAWRCKDYDDGWVVYGDKSAAERHQRNDNCLMQALYTRPSEQAVSEAAREFMSLFVHDGYPPALSVENIDPNELAHRYDALSNALKAAMEAGG